MCVGKAGNNENASALPPPSPHTTSGAKSLGRAAADTSLSGPYPVIRTFVASVYSTEAQVREYSDLICAAGVINFEDLLS